MAAVDSQTDRFEFGRPTEIRLAPYACGHTRSRGRLVPESASRERGAYQRDRDRIIHAGAFRRLKYKTQVFVFHEGDYYRTRLSHSVEVAQIARTLARALGLDEDLAEALALAHDLGHPPFGHAGEQALDACMAPFGGFDHNDQTVRVLTVLERRYPDFDGLNLTWETIEGVAKHNGPLRSKEGTGKGSGAPVPPTIADLDARWPLDLASHPGAEAQVAALADDIAYNNHDVDDGLRAGLIDFDGLDEVPLVGPIVKDIARSWPGLDRRRQIQETVRQMIGVMVDDVLAESRSRLSDLRPDSPDAIRGAAAPVIAFSPALVAANAELKSFLFTRVYRHYKVNRAMSKAKRVVTDLFDLFLAEPNTLPPQWQGPIPDAGSESGHARRVADYIAGMTDRFALEEHARLFDVGTRT